MSEKTNLWTNIFVLAAGILLICMHNDISLLNWMVMFIGAMCAIPGLIGVITGISRSAKNRSTGFSIPSSLAMLVVGIIMLVNPTPFVAIFVYVLAALLIICGLVQVWSLAVEFRPFKMPLWLYIMPVLVIATGVIIICSPLRDVETTFTLIAGIAMVVSAINGLFIAMAAYNSNKVTV